MPSICVLLVDDHPEFLEAAASFLSTDPDIEEIVKVNSGQTALERIAQSRSDVVLMDLVMPEMNGLEATRQIKAHPNAPHVIILTLHDNSMYRALAEAAGADGFMAKSDFGAQLLPVIHQLCEQH